MFEYQLEFKTFLKKIGKLSLFLQLNRSQYSDWKRTNAQKLHPLENKRTKTYSREQTQKKGRVDSPDSRLV